MFMMVEGGKGGIFMGDGNEGTFEMIQSCVFYTGDSDMR
jgi:hypothetical protein